MSYSAEISRNKPTCFLLVIDQSGSMNSSWPGGTMASQLADIVNRLFQNLIIKCSKSEGIRDYFYVGVIGYGQDSKVVSAFEGSLKGEELVPISRIAENPIEVQDREQKIDDGTGGIVKQRVKFPIWIHPVSGGATPMKEAFQLTNKIIENWLNQNPDCFPPVVIHITDGESTDGDPTSEMQTLKNQASSDGNVLLFNLHIVPQNKHDKVEPMPFPSNSESLPNEYAKMLFENASSLTPAMLSAAKEEHAETLYEGAKAFIFNGDSNAIIQALDIGTRPSNLK